MAYGTAEGICFCSSTLITHHDVLRVSVVKKLNVLLAIFEK